MVFAHAKTKTILITRVLKVRIMTSCQNTQRLTIKVYMIITHLNNKDHSYRLKKKQTRKQNKIKYAECPILTRNPRSFIFHFIRCVCL